MKINYIKTVGFRKFQKQFDTELYDVTNISGKNRSGKTNILYAIVNIILGTNLSGDEKSCLINKKCDASYGELHFTDNNNVEHILVRCRHRYKNSENFITLDGKVVTQKDLVTFYIDKKLFLSIINPLYFLSKDPADQKKLVDKYLSDICPNNLMEIVFNQLSPVEQEILEGIPKDIPKYITDLNDDIKRYENLISVLDGKIEYAQNIAKEKLSEKKHFEKDEELSLAKQELVFLNTNPNIMDKENQQKVVERLEKEILSKETELEDLKNAMQSGKKRYLEIKTGMSSICPTCEQEIKDESKNKTVKNLYNDLITKYDKRNLLQSQLSDLKLKLSMERCTYHSMSGNTVTKNTKRIEVVEKDIQNLEAEKQKVELFNNEITLKENNIKNAKSDIKKFNEQKDSYIKCIDNVNAAKKIAQKLYISYIEEKMKLAKKYLKDVNINFYSVLKTTEEIKDDFIITYKNNPLSDLSKSEKVATSLEFANMFNKISKANLPIFIDDYESCADYDFINFYSKDTQLFLSKVEKGNSLKIADNNNIDNYKIIKPIITGYKTMHINKGLETKKVA